MEININKFLEFYYFKFLFYLKLKKNNILIAHIN